MGIVQSKKENLDLKTRINNYKFNMLDEYSSLAVKIRFIYKKNEDIQNKYNEIKEIGKKLMIKYHPTTMFVSYQEISMIFNVNEFGYDNNKIICDFSRELCSLTDMRFKINNYSIPVYDDYNYGYLELYNFLIWRYYCYDASMKELHPDLIDDCYTLLKNKIDEKMNKEFNRPYYRFGTPFEYQLDFDVPFDISYKFINYSHFNDLIIERINS